MNIFMFSYIPLLKQSCVFSSFRSVSEIPSSSKPSHGSVLLLFLRSLCSWTCWSVSAQIWLRISLWVRRESAAVRLLDHGERRWGAAGRSCGGSSEELLSVWVGVSCLFLIRLTPKKELNTVLFCFLCCSTKSLSCDLRFTHWKGFKTFVLSSSVYVSSGQYDYLTLSAKQHIDRLTCDWTDTNTLSHVQVTLPVSQQWPKQSPPSGSQLVWPASCFSSEREFSEWWRSGDQQRYRGRRCSGGGSGGATLPPTGQEFNTVILSLKAALRF